MFYGQSAEAPAAAFFVDRAAMRAMDGFCMSAIFKGMEAESANDALGERAGLGAEVEEPGNQRECQHEGTGAGQCEYHELNERQVHWFRVDW